MAWQRILAALAVATLGASDAPREDAVLLVQQRLPSRDELPSKEEMPSEEESPSEDLKPHVADPEVRYLIHALLGGLHFESAVSQNMLPTRALLSSGEVEPLLVEEGACSPAELSRASTTIAAFKKSGSKFQLPKECPKSKAALLPRIGFCMQKLLNVAPRCAYCHEELAASLSDCQEVCTPASEACPSTQTEAVPPACVTSIGDCMKCATPLYVKNMHCTGGFPRETFDVIKKINAAVQRRNASNTEQLDSFLKKAASFLF